MNTTTLQFFHGTYANGPSAIVPPWCLDPPEVGGFHEKWGQYRLGVASAGVTPPVQASPVKKLGEVIALAKQDIAEAAGVPIDRVKISIDA